MWGEALGADDGAALAECGGKCGDAVVVEVENRGGGRGAAGDTADLLDDVAFERDWCGENERVVEVGAVEVGLVVNELGGLHHVVLRAGALDLHGAADGSP